MTLEWTDVGRGQCDGVVMSHAINMCEPAKSVNWTPLEKLLKWISYTLVN